MWEQRLYTSDSEALPCAVRGAPSSLPMRASAAADRDVPGALKTGFCEGRLNRPVGTVFETGDLFETIGAPTLRGRRGS